MLGFWDSEKVGDTHNEISPLVITITIKYFNVSQIIIIGGISCDIMYSEPFEKWAFKKELYGRMKVQTCKYLIARPLILGGTSS